MSKLKVYEIDAITATIVDRVNAHNLKLPNVEAGEVKKICKEENALFKKYEEALEVYEKASKILTSIRNELATGGKYWSNVVAEIQNTCKKEQEAKLGYKVINHHVVRNMVILNAGSDLNAIIEKITKELDL